MAYKYKIVAMILLGVNFLYSGCGSCPGESIHNKKLVSNPIVSNSLIMSKSKDGNINGLIITSCGKCNFGTKEKGCSLSAKIGDKIYPIQGVGINEHGDAHSTEGFCNAVRVAWATGTIQKNIFNVEYFDLVAK